MFQSARHYPEAAITPVSLDRVRADGWTGGIDASQLSGYQPSLIISGFV